MKKYIQLSTLAIIIAFLSAGTLFAQDDEAVYPIFETLTLVDNQTVYTPYKGSMNLEIQHRFANIKEISDIFGIYGSANTRIGLSYGITDKIMLGLGTTRSYMQQDIEWKYNFLQQTTSNSMPVSLAYYGNAVLDARDSKNFGPESDYKFIYRMSYLHQVIASRKIGEKIGVQVAPTFVYFNAVPEGYRNDNYSLDVGAKFQVLGFHSIVLEYDQPLVQPKDGVSEVSGDPIEAETIYPNLSLGVEIGTSTHSFRVFVSNYNSIVKNRSVAFNDRNPFDFEDGLQNFQFGFNISIRF
jgi:hypothetical protein